MDQQVAVVYDIKTPPWQRVLFHHFADYRDIQSLQFPVVSRTGLQPDYFIPVGAYGSEEEPSPTANFDKAASGAMLRYPSGLEISG
jgi:hypothetical protein